MLHYSFKWHMIISSLMHERCDQIKVVLVISKTPIKLMFNK